MAGTRTTPSTAVRSCSMAKASSARKPTRSHSRPVLAFGMRWKTRRLIANFIRAARAARLPEGEEINAVEYYKELYAKSSRSRWTASSPPVRSMRASPAVKRSAAKFCKCPCSTRSTASWTKPTPARHRRPAHRLRRRQPDARRGPRLPRHHPLPAPARLHRAGRRARI